MLIRRVLVAVVLCTLVLAGLRASADDAADRRLALRQAQEPMRDGNWATATARLLAFRTAHPGTPEAIEAWVLEARAWLEGGQAQRALDATSAFLAAHGEAAWAGRMRHTAARAYEKLGQPAEAAKVLKLLVNASTAPKARAATARWHEVLADQDYEGEEKTDELGRKRRVRNLDGARTGYLHALRVGLPPAEAKKVRIRLAEVTEKRSQWQEAHGLLTQLLAASGVKDKTDLAEVAATDRAAVEKWWVARARMDMELRRPAEARGALTLALERFGAGSLRLQLLDLLGRERIRAGRAGDETAFEEGLTFWRRAIKEHRTTDRARAIWQDVAELLIERGKFEQAAKELQQLAENEPKAQAQAAARYRAAEALAWAGLHDLAVAGFASYLAAHPGDRNWKNARQAIVQLHYRKAVDLRQQDEPDAAIAAYREFASKHPEDPRVPAALVAIGTLLRGEERYEEALKAWQGVVGRHADTRAAPIALGLMAVTLEDDLKRLQEAVETYERIQKDYPRAPQNAEARLRLQRLRAKHLDVTATKVVGLGDAKAVRVETRNIDALKVRVYKLGIEEYFLRKGRLSGVEALQLEIVKPDWTLDWKIDEYKPLALTRSDQTIPVTEAGAYVIVAGNDDLTATTLIFVSDVECVAKRAGHQLVVWAFDRKTQAPVPNARLLLAGKGEVGRTGKDGLYRGRPSGGAPLLLLSGKGPATVNFPAATVSGRGGFRAKAHVSTDRPVYRPGQKVHWRGIFLDAKNGSYRRHAKASGKVRIFDARGRQVHEQEVKGSKYGVFAGELEIDAAAPMGGWRVQLEVFRRGSWSGTFEVQAYRKPEFQITVAGDRRTWRTGDTIKADVTVAYAFGGAAQDRPVLVQVYRRPRTFTPPPMDDYGWYFQDERAQQQQARIGTGGSTLVARFERTTDEDGKVEITVPTRLQDSDAEYLVTAAVRDVTRRWIREQQSFPVTRADHMAAVKLDRKVYKPKQRVKVEIRTMDPSGTPVARRGEVLLMRLKQHKSAPTPPASRRDKRLHAVHGAEEVEVQRWHLTTEENGRGEIEFEMPGPGQWRVRWRQVDASGVIVTAAANAEASGEAEDLTRDARLVAGRTLYNEGENVDLLLRSPVTNTKALLAYEGESVLEARIIDITKGSTLLSLPVRAEHAPNVFFHISIPGEGRLLTADTEVIVLRRLDVKLNVPTSALLPGQEIDISVETRDVSGKRVAAEVGIAVVDARVFGVRRDTSMALSPFFNDHRRMHTVRTGSSLGTRFGGLTRATSKDLIAETAARSGGARASMARSALRLAQEALERGEPNLALAQVNKAMASDPASFEARAFLRRLSRRGDLQFEMAKLEKESGNMIRGQAGLLALDADLDSLEEMALGEQAGAARLHDLLSRQMEQQQFRTVEETVVLADGSTRKRMKRVAVDPGKRGSRADKKRDARPGNLREPSDPTPPAPRAPSGGVTTTGAEDALADMLADRSNEDRKGKPGRSAGAGGRGFSGGHGGQYRGPGGGVPPAFQNAAAGWGGDFGGQFEVRKTFADTAGWFPHVETGESGEAIVRVKLPDNLTTWRLTAHGVSTTALVGQSRASILVRKKLLLRVDPPRFLVQGDTLTLPAVVHNHSTEMREVEVAVDAQGLGKRDPSRATVKVPAGGVALTDHVLNATEHGRIKFEARAQADGGVDALNAEFGVLPRGLRMNEGRSGVIDSARGPDQGGTFVIPPEVMPGTARLRILLHPGLEERMLDRVRALRGFPYGCIEQTVHRYWPAIQARRALRAVGSPAADRIQELDKAIRRGAMRLRNLQQPDGSFGWFGRSSGNLAMTAYAVLGLQAARTEGVGGLEQSLAAGVGALERLLGKGSEDARALGHFALAQVGRRSQQHYASTYRRRADDLSIAGLSWMAMAAHRLGRSFESDELVRMLIERRVESGTLTHWEGRKRDCFVGSGHEATGLAVQALLITKHASQHAERGLEWLLTAGGKPRRTTKENAAVVGAFSAYLAEGRRFGFGGKISVLLDGQVVKSIETGAAPLALADREFEIEEADALRAGKHSLVFRLEGQGRLAWAAHITWYNASKDLPAEERGMRITRRWLEPTKAIPEGQPAPAKPGYTILRPSARPVVEAKEKEIVGSGETILVRLKIESEEALEYVLIEDPLPAGCEVLADGISGPYAWQERRDDRQIFFLETLPKGTTVLEYVLQATHLGRFTALGTSGVAMYLPQFAGRAAGRSLIIRGEGPAKPDQESKPTPDEQYNSARTLLADKSYALARGLFQSLKSLPLRDVVLVKIESALLRIAIEEESAAEIVRAYDELLRRDPRVIPTTLDGRRAIAFAHHAIKEYEVATRLYRDLVSTGLGIERDWDKVLAARGREVEALDRLQGVLQGFPVSNATADASWHVAERYGELARPKGRSGGAVGQPMDAEAANMLWSLTAHFAGTRIAPPATYALIDSQRRMGDLGGAVSTAEAFLRRFPEHHYLDDSLFFLADSRFRQFEQAPSEELAAPVRSAAKRLVERRFPQQRGQKSRSRYRPRAYHLLGSVAHVLGDLDKAIAHYKNASGVADARDALAYLTAEALSTASLHHVGPTDPLRMRLRVRNLKEISFKAWPVDLQVLFALKKSPAALHQVDLAGILPAHAWKVPTPETGDHRPHDVEVGIPDEAGGPGAWLVVIKSGRHETTALILRSDLEAVLQRVGNKVRVYVTDKAGRPVRGAYVGVSDGGAIRARGLTDGRGVFEAPGVSGQPSAVVSKDDQVAIAK